MCDHQNNNIVADITLLVGRSPAGQE